MAHCLRYGIVVVAVVAVHCFALADEPQSTKGETSRLRLLNTAVLGKTPAEPVALLLPVLPGQLDPEIVTVDIDQGRYIAATACYPKEIGFAEARRALNTMYAKHEKKELADDTTMGIWRIEDDKLSIQLTEDDDHLVVIYVKFSLAIQGEPLKSVSRAAREAEGRIEIGEDE